MACETLSSTQGRARFQSKVRNTITSAAIRTIRIATIHATDFSDFPAKRHSGSLCFSLKTAQHVACPAYDTGQFAMHSLGQHRRPTRDLRTA